MYKIKDLLIYPVKSLGGIRLDMANARWHGFELDRNWMLLDQEFSCLTQRELPELALFSLSKSSEELTVTFGNHAISFGIDQINGHKIDSFVWNDPAEATEVDDQVSHWFSDALNRKVFLVRMTNERSRSHFVQKLGGRLPVSFADGYPYLLAGETSLNYLNQQLNEPVDMMRFRPNMVVSTSEPHEEDDWQLLQIGNAGFANIKPCGRCKIVTIDPVTAIQNNEPLTVLSRYRKKDNQVLFGTNMICTKEGMIRIGDTVNLT
ncbi:MAG TPA: MOSC domain-containing protein [Saprospiraceae bacterium]|nr:MOSC domain-containing protein [Saprospiraceae bacterium]